jgi:hypothetical protein
MVTNTDFQMNHIQVKLTSLILCSIPVPYQNVIEWSIQVLLTEYNMHGDEVNEPSNYNFAYSNWAHFSGR